MKLFELETKLLAEGCRKDNICIGSTQLKPDVYCLTNRDRKWEVYYTERGQ